MTVCCGFFIAHSENYRPQPRRLRHVRPPKYMYTMHLECSAWWDHKPQDLIYSLQPNTCCLARPQNHIIIQIPVVDVSKKMYGRRQQICHISLVLDIHLWKGWLSARSCCWVCHHYLICRCMGFPCSHAADWYNSGALWWRCCIAADQLL